MKIRHLETYFLSPIAGEVLIAGIHGIKEGAELDCIVPSESLEHDVRLAEGELLPIVAARIIKEFSGVCRPLLWSTLVAHKPGRSECLGGISKFSRAA